MCRLAMAAVVCGAIDDARAGDLLGRLFPGREPEFRAVRTGRFLLISDHRLDDAGGIATDLEALHRQLQADLKLPSLDATVRIYLFAKHASFSRYVRKHIPYLTGLDTRRHGLFLLRNGVPHMFVLRTADLRGSLRHEFVHVVLNTSAPGLPIWLDEGLAMYYETIDDPAGREEITRGLAKRLACGWQPDLARLEQLDEMRDMDTLAYAEAWAWVRLLTEGPAELRGLLPAFLDDLRRGHSRGGFSELLARRLKDPAGAWQSMLR